MEAAASRVAGANALMNGYISLGLPQALASDDTLHGLVLGQDADPFTPTNNAGLNPWGVQYRPDVPSQVVAFYEAAQTALPTFDPADFLGDLIDFCAFRLRQAINPHIVSGAGQVAPRAGSAPRLTDGIANRAIQTAFRAASARTPSPTQTAANVASAQTPTMFAEANPLIGPTLDRLDLRAGVIQDAINNSPAATTPTTTTTTTPSGTSTTTTTAPTAPTTVPTRTKQPLVTCQVNVPSNKVLLARRRGTRVKPGALAVVIRCDQSAKLTLTGKLTRLVGRKPKHGKQRSTSERIGAPRTSVTAGRSVLVRVKLPADALAALRRGAVESVSFTVRASNEGGSVNVTAKVKRLRRLG